MRKLYKHLGVLALVLVPLALSLSVAGSEKPNPPAGAKPGACSYEEYDDTCRVKEVTFGEADADGQVTATVKYRAGAFSLQKEVKMSREEAARLRAKRPKLPCHGKILASGGPECTFKGDVDVAFEQSSDEEKESAP